MKTEKPYRLDEDDSLTFCRIRVQGIDAELFNQSLLSVDSNVGLQLYRTYLGRRSIDEDGAFGFLSMEQVLRTMVRRERGRTELAFRELPLCKNYPSLQSCRWLQWPLVSARTESPHL